MEPYRGTKTAISVPDPYPQKEFGHCYEKSVSAEDGRGAATYCAHTVVQTPELHENGLA